MGWLFVSDVFLQDEFKDLASGIVVQQVNVTAITTRTIKTFCRLLVLFVHDFMLALKIRFLGKMPTGFGYLLAANLL